MPALIDTSLWIDFTRMRSPRKLKQFVAPFILNPDAVLAEPITFELLRYATAAEVKAIKPWFQMLPLLETPLTIWGEGALLGQACRNQNIFVKPLDLLISAVAIHHGAEVVTFDDHFQRIASVSQLNVKLLKRPTP